VIRGWEGIGIRNLEFARPAEHRSDGEFGWKVAVEGVGICRYWYVDRLDSQAKLIADG